MNSPIFTKYWTALLDFDIASEADSAIALALRLAIDEAAATGVPESAFVAAQNEIAMLRQQLVMLDADNADLTKRLTGSIPF